jgi:hypothetical protein
MLQQKWKEQEYNIYNICVLSRTVSEIELYHCTVHCTLYRRATRHVLTYLLTYLLTELSPS